LFWIITNTALFAQAPQALNYQAIARDNSGNVITGQSVGIRFTIMYGGTTGPTVYQERHQSTTNSFGLFTLAIGKGTVLFGNFSTIDWGANTKFLKVEVTPQGGNTLLQGTTQLLSVPYALYAERSGTAGTQGPAGPQGPVGPTGPAGSQGATGIPGPAGAPGPQGPVGLTGPAGAQSGSGKTVLNGAINPATNIGVDGDFFLNTTSHEIFGPKTGSGWGTGTSLRGLSGLKSLVDLEDFTSSASCPTGGVIVKSGVDRNGNNVLDPNEVDNTKPVCFTQTPNLDKVIMIPLNFTHWGNGPQATSVIPYGIAKFNKQNYPGVDSITLVGNPSGSSNSTIRVQLYNETDNMAISNSSISTNAGAGLGREPFLESANVFNSLPDHPIRLTIQLQGGGSSGECYLYLYRK
jgi:hypothetical protein